jgi:tetratricopeptide (TPR) repeat protein/tRNA A-37 threonylcarbamoyl transferase component Bud32
VDSVDSGSVIQVLDAFDAAWQEQATPPLEPYLPSADHPSRQSILVGLVSIDMERRLKARQTIRTEDYLERFPELRQDEEQLLELVLLEHRLRQQHGLGGSDDLYDRFPQLADRLTVRLRETIPPLPDNVSVVRPTAGLDLPEYALLEALGQGGMGEVYRSRDPGLGRDLALKVLRPRWQGHREAESRFEQEARITGSLQHPGIVPVHNLGRLPDGRLYFTMKVVRGRTFAEILHQPGERAAEQRAEDIVVFEKVCQTLAYAHSKGVIHRDVKPLNIMVGAFGEVQVMDWGLAKVLPRDSARQEEPATDPASSMMPARSEESALHSRAGDVLGTYAYMAPEQACGSVDQLDERCDVFGLGSMLCEVLTGQPPYTGPTAAVLRDRAMRADLAPALARLESCGADGELVALAKRCLAVEPAERPRDAGEVARMVGAYLTGVQQRLREAERKQAAAEARAVEAAARVKVERRARRLLLGLAAAVLVVVLAGGWLWQQRRVRRLQAEQQAGEAVIRGRRLLEEGWQAHDLVKLNEAKIEAERAVDIARRGGASDMLREAAGALQTEIEERLARWEKNHKLLTALLDVAIPEKSVTPVVDRSSQIAAIFRQGVEEQYADAFRDWGLDVDRTDESAIVTRLQEEPQAVVQEVIAGLDAWMMERRRQQRLSSKQSNRLGKSWRHLFGVVKQLDNNAQRRQLREMLVEGSLPHGEMVAGLLGAACPWPALWQLARGNAWQRLQALRREINPVTAPVLTMLLLAQASMVLGDGAGAEAWLRKTLAARPDQVVLLDALGQLLEQQQRLTEAIGCYQAIRARIPGLGSALGLALEKAGQAAEGEAVFRDLIRQQSNRPALHNNLGITLYAQKQYPEAAIAFKESIRLDPDNPLAHHNLGNALQQQNKLSEATASYKKAIHLNPDIPETHFNLGIALFAQNKLDEALASIKEALRLNPDYSEAHANLGTVLAKQKKLPEAVASYKEALRLKPDFPLAHFNLGVALHALGKLPEAVASYKEAIRLNPDYHEAYNNLGNTLRDQGKLPEAVAVIKEAIRLNPNLPKAHYNLSITLQAQGKLREALAAGKEAIRLAPDDPLAHENRGRILYAQGRLPEAVAAYNEAIRLDPNLPSVHANMGNALQAQGKLPEAVAAYEEAIRLKPELSQAHDNLGNVLHAQGKLPEAVAAHKEAIRLAPNDHGGYYNLAIALKAQGKLSEAVAAYKEAIRLKPDFPEAHCNLGNALRRQGKFAEALASLRRGHELGVQRPGWPYPSAGWVRQARRLVDLDRKLPAFLKRDVKPKDDAERIELAELCALKHWYASSARFYADAFTATPATAAQATHRYNAACAAALAGCGRGEDAIKPDDKQRASLRHQALGWLRDDLVVGARRLESGKADDRALVRRIIEHWRTDTDLAGVRDKDALASLPEDERKQWQKLWADVDALHQRAAGNE